MGGAEDAVKEKLLWNVKKEVSRESLEGGSAPTPAPRGRGGARGDPGPGPVGGGPRSERAAAPVCLRAPGQLPEDQIGLGGTLLAPRSPAPHPVTAAAPAGARRRCFGGPRAAHSLPRLGRGRGRAVFPSVWAEGISGGSVCLAPHPRGGPLGAESRLGSLELTVSSTPTSQFSTRGGFCCCCCLLLRMSFKTPLAPLLKEADPFPPPRVERGKIIILSNYVL